MSRVILLTVLTVLGLSGCSRSQTPENTTTWGELIDQVASTEHVARIGIPGTRLLSSADPTGGNDDYNHDHGISSDGWNILADLEGPGYVSRFWFTGAKQDSHRIRFFFDDEKEPRIDTTLRKFCGGEAPFLPPLAANEQSCWWNMVPIPYQKRLRILSERTEPNDDGWPRHFHQINYTQWAETNVVESFPLLPSQANIDRLAALGKAWEAPVDAVDWLEPVVVPAGGEGSAQLANQPGVIETLRIRLEHPDDVSAVEREQALRDIRLQLWWDDQESPSVDVPLGDFFGSVWRETPFQSAYFGADEQGYFSRFPMPFAQSAKIGFLNEGAHPITVHVGAAVEEQAWTGKLGYLHAAWRRSGPEPGRSHTVLDCKGAGRFAGCLLSVSSEVDSWWILESDETMRIDGAIDSQWKGTGLEDYFNGGWYYTNAKARPFHGLLYKSPFRTVQYRTHPDDAVTFQRSFDMTFERGPDQESRGWMASVAYYYLDAPQSSGSELTTAAARRMPPSRHDPIVLMAEVANLERLGGIEAAAHRTKAYLERFPDTPFDEQLKLRQRAYTEVKDGFEAAEPAYRAFLKDARNPKAIRQVEDLLWFHEDPSHALLSLYCANKTTAFLDGRPVATVQDPEWVRVFRVEVEPGAHVLGLKAEVRAYPQWVLAHLRTHYGNVATQPDWRFTFDPTGAWKKPGYDEAGWAPMGSDGVKGPPEVPYRTTKPNAYVCTVSEARGIRPRGPTARSDGAFAFRREFVLE